METSLRFKPLTRHFKSASVWVVIALLAVTAPVAPESCDFNLENMLDTCFTLLNAKRRRIARVNLEMCFPHWPVEKRKQVMMDHFKLYGQAAVDIGMLSLSSESKLNSLMNIKGIEHFRKARNAGHPVILLTTAFGRCRYGWHLACASYAVMHNDARSETIRTEQADEGRIVRGLD